MGATWLRANIDDLEDDVPTMEVTGPIHEGKNDHGDL